MIKTIMKSASKNQESQGYCKLLIIMKGKKAQTNFKEATKKFQMNNILS